MTKRLVLIDGNSLLHRAYHAMPSLNAPDGQPTNAVYGFFTMLFRGIKDLHPEYLAVVFDKKGPTFRHLEFADYKIHRPKMPDDLVLQLKTTHQVLETMNIPIFEIDGYEADDVIGTIGESQKLNKGVETVIVTGDQDALQLVDEQTKAYLPKKGLSNPTFYDIAKVKEKYGFEPQQLVDYKALRGDPSDNIPGVKGIGEKTATKLIQKFGSLEEIYNHLDKVEDKISSKLCENKETAFLSQKLAKIVTDVAIEFELEKCQLKDFDAEEVKELFEKLGFRSLIKRIGELKGYGGQETQIDKRQMVMF